MRKIDKYLRPLIGTLLLLIFSCRNHSQNINVENLDYTRTKGESTYVERKDTAGLIILTPSFSSIDLRCGNIPNESDKDVVLFAEAAYTGAPLEKVFSHKKIAGDHVSAGTRYKGYKCKRNTGAFVYYLRQWKFLYKEYTNELDSAAMNGGAAFAQEMIIHESELKPTARPDSNINTFRALCELHGNLCIIESNCDIQFGTFKSLLKEIGVSESIYLDMGSGWNYAWYRANEDSLIQLHPKVHDFCTNWITFYK